MKMTFLAFLVALSVPSVVASQDCFEYRDSPHWVGGVITGGIQDGVAVAGNLAVVCTSYDLSVVDITSPENPHIVGSIETPAVCDGVAISGNHAYAVARDGYLYVIDITNPESPQIVGSLGVSGVNDIMVSGHYALIVGIFGLGVVDIANPENPQIVGSVNTPGDAEDVAIFGAHAYVADGEPGLQVIDITNPENPQIVGSVDTPGTARGVAVSGTYAGVADGESGLQVIDITDPENPQVVDNFDIDPAVDVEISGNHACVLSINNVDLGELFVIDITLKGIEQTIANVSFPGKGRGVVISGNNAFVTAGENYAGDFTALHVIDISGSMRPPVIGSVDTPGSSSGIAVEGSYTYVADGESGLQVIDTTSPQSPLLLGGVDTPGSASDVTVSGGFAYVADGDSGLQVIDTTNPQSPLLVGGVDTPGYAYGVAISGTHAYVASGNLYVVDITIPQSPQITGSVETPGWGKDVAISGSHAYVADGWSGLQVIDITNPQSPQIIGNVDTQIAAISVAVTGSYVCVGAAYVDMGYYFGQLHVIDTIDPANPQILSSVYLPGWGADVTVTGRYAYVLTWFFGIMVVDITEPENIQIVGSAAVNGRSAAVSAGYAFVGGSGGLRILRAQCAEPIVVEIDIKPDSVINPINCKSRNGVVPVAILTTDIFDATSVDHTTVRFGPDEAAEAHENPTGPIRHEEDVDHDGDMDLLFHFRFNETGIQCGDSEATLTGHTYDGLAFSGTDQIRTVPDGGNGDRPTQAIQITPNPFNPNTTLSFSLDRAQGVRISVFDMAGRRVAEITDRVYGTGSHTVKWNGKDAFGRAVSSGSYLVRIETADKAESQKIMLVR